MQKRTLPQQTERNGDESVFDLTLNSTNPSKCPLTVEQWLEVRRAAALTIDPATAETDWIYALTLDPYGVRTDLPKEFRQVGREYFARSPGRDIWVWFGDLPDDVRRKLWERDKHDLAFPAGLPITHSREP